jgi:hypothetical protein
MLIKICLNATYSETSTGKYIFDTFPAQNYMKQEDVLPPLLLNFALQYSIIKVQEKHIGFILIGLIGYCLH